MTSEGDFGLWLDGQLKSAGKTPTELAIEVGTTRAAVSAWIAGRSIPRADQLPIITAVLNGMPVAPSMVTTLSEPLTARWHHRPAHADGGREYGNAAAFAFDADLSVLAREATQNSLDERFDDKKPVKVNYILHELTGTHLTSFLSAIQWNELTNHLDSAASAPQKVSRSLLAALDDLRERKSLILLRVDDYNAAGLTGPEYGNGRFAAVVRRQLDSHKQSGSRAGGSYGLGKATLWATSQFGLVIVNSTLSESHEGRTERRVVGRLDLPWHEVRDNAFAGPAWLGVPDTDLDHVGVSRSFWADTEVVSDLKLTRNSNEPGTSFLIVGAHDASGDASTLEEMHHKIVRALADGFWAAMVSGRDSAPLLEARVTALQNDQVVVADERVDPHLHHRALSHSLRAYLDGETVDEFTAADQVALVKVPLTVTPLRGTGRGAGKGVKHDAVLLVTAAADGADQANRVICMRGNRMTVFEQRPREIPFGTDPFQAVLLAGYATARDGTDVELAEAFLRASEPPEHDKWDRTEELTSSYEKGSLTRLKEFRSEIDKAVRSVIGKRETNRSEGPKALRDLLKLESADNTPTRRTHSSPTISDIEASVDVTGAWQVSVTLKIPDSNDPWVLTPLAKFDVRSGGRPTLRWQCLEGTRGCRSENGNLFIAPGTRTAAFTGKTDPSSHPVAASRARLMVEIPKARGGVQ